MAPSKSVDIQEKGWLVGSAFLVLRALISWHVWAFYPKTKAPLSVA